MKKQHKILRLLLPLILLLSIGHSAAAFVDLPDVIVSLQPNQPLMKINDTETEIDPGRPTTPVIIDDRTLIPIRAVIEAFGGIADWDGTAQTVTLTLANDTIRLTVNDPIAYLNNIAYPLDVAPAIIHDRTMLPLRFVAEGFHLGVAWDETTQTVTIIRNSFDAEEYRYLTAVIPDYSNSPYVEINQDTPFFKDYEIIGGSFEYYSNLDPLGRCDVCMASIGQDLMPTEKRKSIHSVKPTGWINASYDTVPGKYLYNRCHLIGYQLTGENANEKNLITGTRYLNTDGMLPFENKVDAYIDETGNHVMYRATPVFINDNLVADGVLLEGYSVEDNGRGLSFCVYCYNVQPTVIIDYLTGASRLF